MKSWISETSGMDQRTGEAEDLEQTTKFLKKNTKVVTMTASEIIAKPTKASAADSHPVSRAVDRSQIMMATLLRTSSHCPRKRRRRGFSSFGIRLGVTIISFDSKLDCKKWPNLI
jgi:hypothetical protein